jgi:hypothetical protein
MVNKTRNSGAEFVSAVSSRLPVLQASFLFSTSVWREYKPRPLLPPSSSRAGADSISHKIPALLLSGHGASCIYIAGSATRRPRAMQPVARQVPLPAVARGSTSLPGSAPAAGGVPLLSRSQVACAPPCGPGSGSTPSPAPRCRRRCWFLALSVFASSSARTVATWPLIASQIRAVSRRSLHGRCWSRWPS